MLKVFVNVGTFPRSDAQEDDGVLAYAKEVLSLALLRAEFDDAIRERDGLRVINIQSDKSQIMPLELSICSSSTIFCCQDNECNFCGCVSTQVSLERTSRVISMWNI